MKNFIKAITVQSFDTAALTGGYDLFSAAGLPQACSILRIYNDSNVSVGLSYDAIDTHDIIPSLQTLQLYLQTNSQPNNKRACFAKGTPVSLIGNPGVGLVYLIGYYQE